MSKPDDDYASRYMRGAGQVLHRDKVVGRMLVAILGLVTLWCAGGAVGAALGALPKSSPAAAVLVGALAAFFALLTMTLTVVRTVVSQGRIEVQYGLWGPRVPIERVRSCRVVPYDWAKFGGWGIKRSFDGTWAYVLKATGDVVELVWTDDAGEERRAVFSATDPAAVVAAVQRARDERAGARIAPSGARIAEDAVEGEAEREAEAVAEEAAGERRKR